MQAGRLREDLYYRLCTDRIETPGLRSQLDDRPDDLYFLVQHITAKIAGDDSCSLCEQAVQWINEKLGASYPWRGNFRELEQCVSSIMIRGQYTPVVSLTEAVTHANGDSWDNDALHSRLSADELLQRYCTWIYFKTGQYEAAARKLKIDRRTVKAKVNSEC